ncbi:MAG: carboxypeptidase-like regulatory domain-containing protein [Ignavibacteria bacterium]|jgi:hypothetical protein
MNNKEFNCYPVFETNQILTSTQLNRLREKQEFETSQTRFQYIGAGILCKFYFVKKGSEIIIHEGHGLTSYGHRIYLDTKTSFDKFVDFTEHVGPKYDLWYGEDSEGQQKLKDIKLLIPAAEKNDDAQTLDNVIDLEQRVVVAFYDLEDKQQQTCTGNDCDNKGIKREESIKFLLVKKSDLSDVNLEKALRLKNKINHLRLTRLHSAKNFKLNQVDSKEKLDSEFSKAIDNYYYVIGSQIFNAYKVYGKILGLEFDIDKEIVEKLFKKINKAEQLFQYWYDFLSDLLLALYEFSGYAYELLCNYRIDYDDFPRHLMLGEISIEAKHNVLQYRNYFLKAPVFSKQDKKFLTARMLFEKIIHMITNFVVPVNKKTVIKITPGKYFPQPFSKFTIPFVYKPVGKLLESWNPEYTLQGRQFENLSYYFNNEPVTGNIPVYVSDPLSYNINDYPFFRIEGHVGKKIEVAEKRIDDYKKEFNLDFKLVSLQLEPHKVKDINELKKIFMKKCGIDEIQNLYSEMRIEFVFYLKNVVNEFQGGVVPRFLENIREYGFNIKKKILVNEILDLAEELTEAVKADYSDDFLRRSLNNVPEDFQDININKFLKSLNNLNELLIKTNLLLKVIGKIVPLLSSGRVYFNIPIIKNEVTSGIKVINKLLYCCFTNRVFFFFRALEKRVKYFLKNDLAIFSNYVKKYTGVEHIAGVLSGGTFILVYNEDGIVVADFALRSLCCCDICLFPPIKVERLPVAVPIYVEIIRDKIDTGISAEIKIVHQDYPPEILKDFTWKLTGDKSYKGAELDFNPKKMTVNYKGKGDYLTDRFEYALTSDKYDYKGKAFVYVLVKTATNGILDAVDDIAATVKNKPILIDVLGNDVSYSTTELQLISPKEKEISKDIITILGAKVSVKEKDKKKFVYYEPSGEGFDEFNYVLVDPNALNKAEAKVSVIVYCCDKECIDVAYRDEKNLLYVLNEFELKNEVKLKLFKTNPEETVSELVTGKKGEAVVARDKNDIPVIGYLPAEGFRGKDRFGYVVIGKNYYRYCNLNVLVIGEHEEEEIECSLPQLERIARPGEEFKIDFTEEVPHAQLKGLGEIDEKIVEAKITDDNVLYITPGEGILEVKEYTFNYTAFDKRAEKECSSIITLILDPEYYGECSLPVIEKVIKPGEEFTIDFEEEGYELKLQELGEIEEKYADAKITGAQKIYVMPKEEILKVETYTFIYHAFDIKANKECSSTITLILDPEYYGECSLPEIERIVRPDEEFEIDLEKEGSPHVELLDLGEIDEKIADVKITDKQKIYIMPEEGILQVEAYTFTYYAYDNNAHKECTNSITLILDPEYYGECSLPVIKKTVLPGEEFEIDFNEEGPHASLIRVGEVSTLIATVEIIDDKKIYVMPHKGIVESKEYKFPYYAFDEKAHKECTSSITLTLDAGYYGECNLPEIRRTVLPGEEFEIDFNEEGPHVKLISLDQTSSVIAEAEILDEKTISIIPWKGMIEVKEYTFNYHAYDENTNKECSSTITLTLDPDYSEECTLPDLSIGVTPGTRIMKVNMEKYEKTKGVTLTEVTPDVDGLSNVTLLSNNEFSIELPTEFEVLYIHYKGDFEGKTGCTGIITFTIQEFTVTGKVTINGDPLYNATVFIKDIDNYAITDDNGNYEITVPTGSYEIHIVYDGVLQRVEQINNRNIIDINLTELTKPQTEIIGSLISGTFDTDEAISLRETDENLSANYNSALEFYEMVNYEFTDNYEKVRAGSRNNAVLEAFTETFGPVIKEINNINKEIKNSGATKELTDKKSLNMELLKAGLNALLTTAYATDKELSKNTKVYKYFNEEFSKVYKKLSTEDKEKLDALFNEIAAMNRDKSNLSEVLAGYSK